MGLFSWFGTAASNVEGLDDAIPQKTQCYHIVSTLNNEALQKLI